MNLPENTQILLQYIRTLLSFNPEHPLLFTQFHFWAFFAIVYTGFALTANRKHLRNTYLFLVSLLFYYKTSGLYLLLLLFVTVSDFLIAKKIHHTNPQKQKKLWLTLSITIDLTLLCYFKYAYFLTDILNTLLGTTIHVKNILGQIANTATGKPIFNADNIILPVGISFYTFQIISYTVDVYRGLVKPVRNFFDFAFYVSFFPQLVAGPIVKATDFIPQLYRKFTLSRTAMGLAVFWIINGLLKKIILSDYIAVNFVDRVFNNPLLFTGFENLAALFAYSLQVYADFSGYTDIAIGLSLLMGFHLPRNFNAPYKATSCANFWKRWHISLSRWLQYYLYIPLGGNRNATPGTYFWIIIITLAAIALTHSLLIGLAALTIAAATLWVGHKYPQRRRKIWANLNSIITMLLGGLWHGASINFMIWGGLNGAGIITYKFWRDFKPKHRTFTAATALLLAVICNTLHPAPVWNLIITFLLIIFAGTLIQLLYTHLGCRWTLAKTATHAWAVGITFVFITFTRLFFRSGSNLDPAIANRTAWTTATQMVNQIGTAWNTPITDIITTYKNVFILFTLGMIIHWLPENLKRRYRILFARMPLWLMAVTVCLAVLIAYQFVTAEMQPFIYFQF